MSLPPIEVPTLLVQPESGPFAGRTIRMRYPSTRFWIAQQRGELDNETMWTETLLAVEEHDFGRDPDDLPPAMVLVLMTDWLDALKADALPPTTGSD